MFANDVPQRSVDPDVQITIDTLVAKINTLTLEELSLRIELNKRNRQIEQLENIVTEMQKRESDRLNDLIRTRQTEEELEYADD